MSALSTKVDVTKSHSLQLDCHKAVEMLLALGDPSLVVPAWLVSVDTGIELVRVGHRSQS